MTAKTSEQAAFEHWHSRQIRPNGTRRSPDKAIVAAINEAIKDILDSPGKTVDATMILEWIWQHLKFADEIVDRDRIDEHCLYEAGKSGTATKVFDQPKKRATLSVVSTGIYGLALGKTHYEFTQR